MPPTPFQVEPEPHESIDIFSTIDSYNLPVITPCSSTPNPHSLVLPMLFHLLTCGHIVTIDDPDRRCARNCHHTTDPRSSRSSEFPDPQPTQSGDGITFTDDSKDIHADTLYCEVCTAIPFDRYYIMFPPADTTPLPRRCLALSRAIIAGATLLPAPAIEELLCPVLYVPGRVPHELKCGHRVWCLSERRCGVNCREEGWKGEDGLVCGKCIWRGERVHGRYWG
ncbi:hypothetical protein COCCADRAFT_40975 [Bipolaris zeicola 26-R-13]|uniref:Uncharacterized protein n=1 Tax=Cochliobolus carbonum (strain 26-R-13) TaxID=930089 RepID=W6YBJ3_COCC2|nr:uncharacterized protein COCCADRAFT_40975 [Bipolaris zeicola 26-R-13]EUC28521.1 hypothetical protein COCCADRAFT_40975 [Bipolaris zeicola 26-R-13]